MKNWRYVFGMRKPLRWTLFFNYFLHTLRGVNSFPLRSRAAAHFVLSLHSHFHQNFVANSLYSFLEVHHKHYIRIIYLDFYDTSARKNVFKGNTFHSVT